MFRKVLINSILLTLGACTLPSNIPANFGAYTTQPVTLLSITVTPSSLGISEIASRRIGGSSEGGNLSKCPSYLRP